MSVLALPTLTRGSTASPWLRMDRTDAGWAGSSFSYVATGLALPSVDDLVQAMGAVLEQDPRLGAETHVASGHYRVLDDRTPTERAAELLAGTLPEGATGPEALAALRGTTVDGAMFRWYAGPDQLAVRWWHGAGDAWSCLTLLRHVQQVALTGVASPLPYDVLSPRTRDRFLLQSVACRPDAVAYAAWHRRELSGGAYEPASRRPGTEVVRTIARTSDSDFVRRVKAERTRWGDRRVSMAAVLAAGMRRHLADRVLAPVPGLEMLFGLRQGIAERAFGNWASGVYVRAADDDDPASVTEAMDRVRDRGLPQVAALASRRRARLHQADQWVLAPQGRPRLCITHLNSWGPQNGFTWAADRLPRFCSEGEPNGLETILVGGRETEGELELSVTFHPAAWHEDDVAAVVDAFLEDPFADDVRRTR